MEIEAKFTAPDEATFLRLLQVDSLARFALSAPRLKRLHDHYLDTAGHAFLRGGYACRVRMDGDGGRLVTLKSLTPAQGLLHERHELEVRLPAHVGLDQAAWPACDATELAHRLSQGELLAPLFDLWQERHWRLATPVGSAIPAVELSLDRTSFRADGGDELLGVEAELLPGGDRAALDALVEALQQGWGLVPEPTPKFERGLAQARPELIPLLRAR